MMKNTQTDSIEYNRKHSVEYRSNRSSGSKCTLETTKNYAYAAYFLSHSMFLFFTFFSLFYL